jgi:hypothetical protein
MNARRVLVGLLLAAVNATALACDLPKLIAVPDTGKVGNESSRLIVEMQSYVTGIRAYTACIQAELAAAGGDAAPESLRGTLITRNNAAVDEARTVIALFGERVAPIDELYLAEFLSGDSQQCIDQTRLEQTGVVDDFAVILIQRGGRTYLNVLEQACTDLARFGHFDIRGPVVDYSRPDLAPPRTLRLCADDFILPYAFEGEPLRSRECALGQFFEVSQEQAARLLAIRAARQQPGEEPVEDRAEEMPARRRSER